jgi:hypothetical protein
VTECSPCSLGIRGSHGGKCMQKKAIRQMQGLPDLFSNCKGQWRLMRRQSASNKCRQMHHYLAGFLCIVFDPRKR